MMFGPMRGPSEAVPTAAVAALGISPDSTVLTGAAQHHRRADFDYLLLFRFALINLVGLSLLVVAQLHGFVEIIRAGDPTRLSIVIAGIFVVGLVLCAVRIWRVSCELNEVRAEMPRPDSKVAQYLNLVRAASGESRAIVATSLRLKLVSRIVVVRHIASTLVIMGLLGTVVGFIISLGGVRAEVASDASAVTPMITTLIKGMSIALGNTLVGGVLNVWLTANYHVLASGTARLISAILERGVARVG